MSKVIVLAVLLHLAAHVQAAVHQAIVFSAEEKAYIERVGSIRMCVDPDWIPFEHINAQGQHEGIAADLVQLVAQRVGLKIELFPIKTWDESLAASKAGRCQIMSFLNQTPAREQWLIFTQPIFYDQNIIVTREEHPYIGDPKDLSEKTIVLPRGTMVEERVRRDFPRLKVITTGSEPEAMTFVSERKADMTVRSLIVAAHAIRKEGLFNLKISGQIPAYANQLRIGVLKDEPLLRDILDKGVATITPQEREAIANKHVAVTVQQGVDYTLAWQIALGGTLIMLLVLYWNRKLNALNRELAHLSITDKLTGLFNRLKLDEVLNGEIERAARFVHPFSVILMDIDHFKQVNDRYGHQAGDQVLQAFAGILGGNTRKVDTVGRWGGEEFLLICPNTDSAGARQLAENLRAAIEAHDFPPVGGITASFGISSFQVNDQANDIVARADEALYAAKNNGRNCVGVQ